MLQGPISFPRPSLAFPSPFFLALVCSFPIPSPFLIVFLYTPPCSQFPFLLSLLFPPAAHKPLFFLVLSLSPYLPLSLSFPHFIIISFMISAFVYASISLYLPPDLRALHLSACLLFPPFFSSSPLLLSSLESSSSSSWRVGATQQDPDTVRQMLPRPVTKEVVSLATEFAGMHFAAPSLSYYSKY